MKALIQGHERGGNDSNAVFKATRGVLYMGCPHMGRDFAAWTSFIARLASVSSRTVSLKPALCVNTQETFLRMLREYESEEEVEDIKSYCFYELLSMDDEIDVLLPEQFATRGPTDNAPIWGTHTTMTQFANEDDAGYQAVKDRIWEWAQNFRIPDTTRFRVSCNLRKFYEGNYDVDFRTFIEEAVVVTGESVHAEVTTTGEYLRRCWPKFADGIIRALHDLKEVESWSKLPSLQSDVSLAEDESSLNISAFDTGDYSYFDVRGSRKDVQSVKSALTWLCAGFQEYEFLGKIEPKWENRNSLHFDSRKLEKGEEGTCWFDLFGNIGVVSGLTADKPSNIPGLEISLDKMAALLDTDRVTTFAGKVFIKGFDAMLALVDLKQTENICVWHLWVNDNGEHICYTDERVREVNFNLEDGVDLGSFRHIVGWCSKVKNLTGQRSADYTSFKDLNLDRPSSEVSFDRLTLSGGMHVTASSSVAIGRRQKPTRGPPQTVYEKQLEWASRQHVLLFDVGDRRAWLVNGCSALLHLVRASLKRSQLMHTRGFLFDSSALKEPDPTIQGVRASRFVLEMEENKYLKIFKLDDEITGKPKKMITTRTQTDTFQPANTSSIYNETWALFGLSSGYLTSFRKNSWVTPVKTIANLTFPLYGLWVVAYWTYWWILVKALIELVFLTYGIWALSRVHHIKKSDSWTHEVLSEVSLKAFIMVLLKCTRKFWSISNGYLNPDENEKKDVKYHYFKDEVRQVYNLLEQIVAESKNRASQDGFSVPSGDQLTGYRFLDLINGESSLEPKMIRLESRGKSWIKYVSKAHAITLFGSGFGELLKPLRTDTTLCSYWKEVPKEKDYLAVSVEDLTRLLREEQLGIDKYHGLFSPCYCPSKKHCERGQMLIKKDPSAESGQDQSLALTLEGAVILGQPDSSAQIRKNIANFSGKVKERSKGISTWIRKIL